MQIIGFQEGERHLQWGGLLTAFEEGHKRPKAQISDSFLYRGEDTLLSRAAWIDGVGQAVKTATIFPANTSVGMPSVHGAVSLFCDKTGALEAMLDFHLVTKWKTAGDSLYAAKRLARRDAQNFLIIGSGSVAGHMLSAYSSAFANARFTVWSRTASSAEAFAKATGAKIAQDLEQAVREADVICTATMTRDPIVQGDWLQPGQHLDLIGAYRPDMREVDDACLTRARLFVDSYETTLDHIGELKIPLETGVINRNDIVADFYTPQAYQRFSQDEITIAKNGGGAHLDLMTCRYILNTWRKADEA